MNGCLRVPGFLEARLWLDSGGGPHARGTRESPRRLFLLTPELIPRAVDKCPL
jgi:hypothetical protein